MKRIVLLVYTFVCCLSTFAVDYGIEKQITIKSAILDRDEVIYIAIPQVYYDENYANLKYNVMYVFDSQSPGLFDMVKTMQFFAGGDYVRNSIIVGITHPYIKERNWGRNNDLLPLPNHCKKEEFYGGCCGGAENLKLFLTKELIPYIDKNYRTTKHRIAIGHSLSASFILDCMLTCDPFDDYIAVSPNFAYDQDRLAEDFIHFDFSRFDKNKYVYISNANEEKEKGWEVWKPAREKVYNFLATSSLPDNLKFIVDSFPTKGHWECFPSAIYNGEAGLFKYMNNPTVSKQAYPLTIRIIVPDSVKTLYITGNQDCLGNWDPHALKMKKVNSTTFEVKIQAYSPAQFKFTSGSWDPEVVVEDCMDATGRKSGAAPIREDVLYQCDGSIVIDSRHTSHCEFKLKEWATY